MEARRRRRRESGTESKLISDMGVNSLVPMSVVLVENVTYYYRSSKKLFTN